MLREPSSMPVPSLGGAPCCLPELHIALSDLSVGVLGPGDKPLGMLLPRNLLAHSRINHTFSDRMAAAWSRGHAEDMLSKTTIYLEDDPY